MLDWLRQDPREQPHMTVGGKRLPIVVRRHPRARRMVLRLAPDGSEARVTIPSWSPTADALAFARSREAWLEQQLGSLPEHEPVGPGSVIAYRGSPVAIAHSGDAPRKPVLDGAMIRLGGAAGSVRPRLRRWLEGEARRLLTADISEYSRRSGRAPSKLALSSARRRWGSCAPDGAIRINWRLIMAPDLVRRSVVAHEVAHLVHFDHSPRFHALLARLYEADIGEANDWLKREGRTLYLPFG